MSSAQILLVEDEKISRKVIADTLTNAGYSVDTCEDGAQAVERFEQGNNYEVVLLDRLMPVMNGLECLQKFNEKGYAQNSVIVMLTAVSDHEAIAETLEAGAQDYLTKPVDPEELLALLGDLIES